MALPAVVWGGIWAAGAIGARMTARQIVRRVTQAAARRALSREAANAYSAAVAAGTLAPESHIDLDGQYSNAQDKADALARTLAAACAAEPGQCEACDANRGQPSAPPNRNLSPRAAEYQQFISGFPRGVEYRYNGVDFDGFWRSVCTLVEAKDAYTQFMDVRTSEGGVFSSAGIRSVDWRDWFSGAGDLNVEARRQVAAAVPSPPVLLQWHCSQIALTILLTEQFGAERISIVPQYTPHPSQADPFGDYIE